MSEHAFPDPVFFEQRLAELGAAREHMRRDLDQVLTHAAAHGIEPVCAVMALLVVAMELLAILTKDPAKSELLGHELLRATFATMKVARERAADA